MKAPKQGQVKGLAKKTLRMTFRTPSALRLDVAHFKSLHSREADLAAPAHTDDSLLSSYGPVRRHWGISAAAQAQPPLPGPRPFTQM